MNPIDPSAIPLAAAVAVSEAPARVADALAPAATDGVVLPVGGAAQDAAAFVARIFADVSASDRADAAPAGAPAQHPADAAPALPPVPAGWPANAAQPLQGQHLLILGLGASGLAMARWCVRCGAQVTVADTRADPPQRAVLA